MIEEGNKEVIQFKVGDEIPVVDSYKFSFEDLSTQLKNIGVETKVNNIKKKAPLEDKKFIFTGGLLNLSRPDASDLVKKMGGIVAGSVRKNIDYVVVGDKPGSEYKKAKKLGLKIINDEEFMVLVNKWGDKIARM